VVTEYNNPFRLFLSAPVAAAANHHLGLLLFAVMRGHVFSLSLTAEILNNNKKHHGSIKYADRQAQIIVTMFSAYTHLTRLSTVLLL
jgi:hypothetical protein